MQKYMAIQKKKIEYEKWLEGIRIRRDPDVQFILEWIDLYAANFRQLWEESLCKICKNWEICGCEVKKSCKNFDVID